MSEMNQSATLKKFSSLYGYPIKEIRADFLLSIETDEIEIEIETDEIEIETDEIEPIIETEIIVDVKKMVEYENRIAHYKKFNHSRLYEYIEIVEKIRAKKEVYFLLKVDGREVTLSSSEISNPQKIATALSRSFRATTTKRANLLAEYLESFDDVIHTPYIKGVNRTGWNGKSFFLPNRDNKKIKLISNEDGLSSRYVQKGDIRESERLIHEMSYKKSFIPFLGSLSAPLYGVINQMGAFNHATHINGASGRGKTLSITLALSLFGDPKEFKNNFSQTLQVQKCIYLKTMICLVLLMKLNQQKGLMMLLILIICFLMGRGKQEER
jgi:uncharacterized protein (DUF927 family)